MTNETRTRPTLRERIIGLRWKELSGVDRPAHGHGGWGDIRKSADAGVIVKEADLAAVLDTAATTDPATTGSDVPVTGDPADGSPAERGNQVASTPETTTEPPPAEEEPMSGTTTTDPATTDPATTDPATTEPGTTATPVVAKSADGVETVTLSKAEWDKRLAADTDRDARIAKMEHDAELQKAETRAGDWDGLPGLVATDAAPHLVDIAKNCSAETAKWVTDRLDQVHKAFSASDVFHEFGSTNGDTATPYAQMVAKAEKLVADGTVRTVAEGVTQIMKTEPALADEYFADQRTSIPNQ